MSPKHKVGSDAICNDPLEQVHQMVERSQAGVAALHERLDRIDARLNDQFTCREQVSKGEQLLLALQYRALAAAGDILPFSKVGFRNYSQQNEDGILHYIFSLIGSTNCNAVEICAGVGYESLSANLILNHDWYALLVDGNDAKVEAGRAFFNRHPSTRFAGPVFLHRWIDRESVNEMISGAGFSGEIDLLVIDLDGVDYWIWEAIEVVSPRVVILEAGAHLGDRAITVPYSKEFATTWIDLKTSGAAAESDADRGASSLYSRAQYGGASVPAMTKLSAHKGYRLVGASVLGSNLIFLRDDVGTQYFPAIPWQDCIRQGYDPVLRQQMYDTLMQREWVEV